MEEEEMDDDDDELLVEDMEMVGEDELLFLNIDADAEGAHALALRRRRRALPKLPLADGHQQRRRASHRGSRRQELTSPTDRDNDVPSVRLCR
ncbi:WRKY transcription factor 22 [Zea mays]|nr:WRKY transcription factor 22 [Zea mays]